MKVTTKLAKSGARLFYVDSKRVSRDKALESAAQNRVGNPFVIEYDTEQTHYFAQGGIKKSVYTARNTFETLKLRIDSYKGFTVYCNGCQLRTFAGKYYAQNFAAKIEDAFIDGEHGIKIAVDGTISILPDIDDYAVTVDAQDSAIESEIQNAGTVAEMSTISITEYNTMLSWAEKISNGQRDAVTQIKTHAKKWFNVDADKEEIIGIIEDGGLNGFRNNFLAKINFRVQDNASYFHKLCKCGEDNYVLCEMPAEPKTVDAEIEQAAGTVATETKISEEPEITKAEKITAVIADAKDFIATNLDARTEKVFKLCFGIHASIHFYLNNLKGKLFSELHAIEDEMSKFKGTAMKFYDAYLAASDGYLDSEEMTALYYHICDCVAGGYSTAVYDQTRNIAKEILDKLGEETLMREIAKVTDEFGISRDLLNQSDHCDFKPFNLDTAHDTPAEISEEPEIDEDEAAEKFYRETESIYRKMKSDAYFAHEFLREHIFDIYDYDYALSVRNQRNEYKACPNKFHLVDTRFDVEVDRNDLEYVIYYGRTELARYRKIESVNNAVDRLVIAIVNHRFEFAFPAELPDETASDIIQIDTNGTTEIGGETMNFCNAKPAPVDNFDTQVADALKAAHVAKAILDEKDAVVEKAKAESRKACDVYEAAKADILKLYERKAAELTAKIKPPKRFLKVIKQDGREDFIRKDLFVHVYEGYDWDKHFSTYHFAIAKYDIREGNRLGIYDTPAQVEFVIDELKAAIKRGDEEFTFPTVDEVTGTEISEMTA